MKAASLVHLDQEDNLASLDHRVNRASWVLQGHEVNLDHRGQPALEENLGQLEEMVHLDQMAGLDLVVSQAREVSLVPQDNEAKTDHQERPDQQVYQD